MDGEKGLRPIYDSMLDFACTVQVQLEYHFWCRQMYKLMEIGCFCELILDSWCRSLRKMAQIASPRIKRFRWCAVLPQVTCYESQGSIFESIKIEIFDCPTQLMVKYDVCCSVGP